MYAYRFLRSCGRLVAGAAREVFTGLKSFGAALIGMPLPPEAFPRPTSTDAGATAPRPVPGPTRRPTAGPDPGAPPAGHPERLIPHVPPTPVERRLWSQLR